MSKIPEHLTYTLYCDGGVIGKNPSKLGGTWAWCLVNWHGKRVACDSGIVRPDDVKLPAITNNLTELLAVIKGLESMQRGWSGLLYTDSKVTWWRLTTSNKFNGIPKGLQDRCIELRKYKKWTPMLCGGHPNENDLEIGYDSRGLPTSVHNVWCDARCTKLSKRFARPV